MGNKNIIYLTALLSIVTPLSFAADKAQDSPFKIRGEVNSQFGIVNQQKDFRKNLKTNNRYNKNSLANSGTLKFNYDQKTEKGLGYGAYIELNASTSKSPPGSESIAGEVKLYVQDSFGKIELGSTSPVGSAMEVNSYSLARATGGLYGDWNFWLKNGGVIGASTTKNYAIGGNYLTAPQLPVGFDETTKAGKINYFSPKVNGFTFGLSFTPDSKAKGTVSQTSNVPKNTDGGYKNIWQPAVRYETTFGNGMKFATAVLGEFGNAKKISYYSGIDKLATTDPDEKDKERKNLKAWQIGVSVDYKGLAFAGSYGDIGKSGVLKDDPITTNKKSSKYWSLGSAYSTEKYGISINYMQSKRAGFLPTINNGTDDKAVKFNESEYNKFEALSIGADYLVMPGFIPYVEITKFKFKENKNFNQATNVKFNKGTVILAGTKIQF